MHLRERLARLTGHAAEPPRLAAFPLQTRGDALAQAVVDRVGEHAERWGLTPDGERALREHLDALAPEDHVALLKACVARMPELRESGADGAYATGAILYAAARRLFDASLPLTEHDVAEILRASRHGCGHGEDVRPPLELALEHQRAHGFSPVLAAAIRDFVADLPRTQAAKMHNVKRHAALLSVLDAGAPIKRGAWIATVRTALLALDESERRVWERLVLRMKLNEQMRLPRSFAADAEAAIGALGRDRVVQRLEEWWPAAGEPVSLDGGGLPLLKHLLWLLEVTGGAEAERLACRIASVEFRGRGEPMGVLKPALAILSGRDGERARAAAATLEERIAGAEAAH